MRIMTLFKRDSACDYHRITVPFRNFPMQSGDSIRGYNEEDIVHYSDFKNVDVVIFNRIPHLKLEPLLELRQKYGFKIVVDVDDYWHLYNKHVEYKAWTRNNIPERQEAILKIADMVWVTNERLRGKVLPFNPETYVIKNAIPFGTDQFQFKKKTQYSKARILYTGGISHRWDLNTISYPLKKLGKMEKFTNKCEFVLAGYNPVVKNKDSEWWNIEQIVANVKSYTTKPPLTLYNYMDFYDSAELCIAPLENNEFNTFKSNLKILEAGCKKLPIICSKVYPYLEDEEMHTKGLILCDSAFDWTVAMKTIGMSKFLQKEMGEMLHQYVLENYHLDDQNAKRYALLKNLL